jgi:hypothetical protein
MKKSGLTLLKGVLLVGGGTALGFFGCLGGLQANSTEFAVGSVIVGGVVVAAGIVVILIGFVTGLIGMRKPKE